MRAKGLDEADAVRSRRRVNHCIGFDFHSHFGTDDGDHLHHRAGRADIAKYLAVRSTDRFSIVDVGDVNDDPLGRAPDGSAASCQVRIALSSNVLVITGGPGVGKTTLVNSIQKILIAK